MSFLLQILSFISDIINRPYTCQPVYLSLKRARQLGWLFEQVCVCVCAYVSVYVEFFHHFLIHIFFIHFASSLPSIYMPHTSSRYRFLLQMGRYTQLKMQCRYTILFCLEIIWPHRLDIDQPPHLIGTLQQTISAVRKEKSDALTFQVIISMSSSSSYAFSYILLCKSVILLYPIPTIYHPSLQDLGITPTPMENVAFSYLHRFRQKGHFALVKGYHQA